MKMIEFIDGVENMQNKTANKSLAKSQLVLLIIITSLIGIFSYRTLTYFKQVEVQTSSAVLFKKASLDSTKIENLPKGSRLTILNSKYHWFYVKTQDKQYGWIADWMIAKDQYQTITSLSNATIVIDAGHGGNDAGALSTTGKMEKVYTLKYAESLANKLRKLGAKVYLTRSKDEYVGLGARPALADKLHADAFISFHFDSSPVENTATGFTTYYYHKKTSYKLANYINSSFSLLGLDNRGIEVGDFLVIRDIDVPAILLEMGYINSDRDFEQISDSSYQNKVIDDITNGLRKYFASNAQTG